MFLSDVVIPGASTGQRLQDFMQLFPHEVSDLQPVLDLLCRQDPKDTEVS